MPLRHLCQVSDISLGKSIVDKMVASFRERSAVTVCQIQWLFLSVSKWALMGWKGALTWLGIAVCCYRGLVLAQRQFVKAVMVPHFIECDALATMQLPVL